MGLFGKSKFNKAFEPYTDIPGYTPPKKPSFAEGGKFRAQDALGLALASFGDALAQNNGGQAWATPMIFEGVQRARKAKAEAEARQQERMTDREDWKWQQDYELAHRPPPTPTADQQNFAWWDKLSPEEKARYDQFDPVIAATWQGPVPVPRSTPLRPAIGSIVDDAGNPVAQSPASQSVPMEQIIESVRERMLRQYPGPRGESEFIKWKLENGLL